MLSTSHRLFDVVTSPFEAAEHTGGRRSWWDILAICALAAGVFTIAMWVSPGGQRIAELEHERIVQLARERVPADQLEAILAQLGGQRLTPMKVAYTGTQAALSIVMQAIVIASILHFTLTILFLRRDVRFTTVLAVCGHAAVPIVIGIGCGALLSSVNNEITPTTLSGLFLLKWGLAFSER